MYHDDGTFAATLEAQRAYECACDEREDAAIALGVLAQHLTRVEKNAAAAAAAESDCRACQARAYR